MYNNKFLTIENIETYIYIVIIYMDYMHAYRIYQKLYSKFSLF